VEEEKMEVLMIFLSMIYVKAYYLEKGINSFES